MFDQKGVIVIEKTDEIDEDVLMEAALEAGMDDMVTYDDCYEILTAPNDFNDVSDALKAAGYAFVDADIEYLPSVEATPTEEHDIKNLKKMIEMLEDNDDVQKVYHNCTVELED